MQPCAVLGLGQPALASQTSRTRKASAALRARPNLNLAPPGVGNRQTRTPRWARRQRRADRMPDPRLIARAALSLVLSVLLAKAWKWARRIYLLSRIPGPKGDRLGGQMKHFSQRSDHHKSLQRWAAEYGGIYRIRLVDTTVRLGTRRKAEQTHVNWAAALTRSVQMVVVSDPLLVDTVLARGKEVEKSVDAIYSRLNIVRPQDLVAQAVRTMLRRTLTAVT